MEEPNIEDADQTVDSSPFQFSEENVKRLKEKYMEEMKRESGGDKTDEENPMRACMRIMFEAANERDPIKRAELACELSKLLIQPAGLINLFLSLIDFDTSSQKTTTHNQRFLAVANIIAHLPKLCLPYLEYCDNLQRQLKLILVHTDTRYSSLASLIIKALLESPHASKTRQQVQEILLNPFIEPLTRGEVENLKPHHAILAIHNLIQNQVPTRLFVYVFPNLFYAQATLNETPSLFKSYLKATLTIILNDLKPGPACCLLEQTIFHHQEECDIYTVVTDTDQITLGFCKHDKEPLDFDSIRQVVLRLLEDCANELFVLEFFFHFQAKMWICSDNAIGTQCAALIEPLLEQTIEEKQTGNKLDLLASIISNGKRALELISRTLLNYLDLLRLHQHDNKQDIKEWQELVSPSLNNCLDILEVLFNTLGGGPSGISSLRGKIANTLREIRDLIRAHKVTTIFDKQLVQNLELLVEKLAADSDQFQVPKAANIASREYDEAMRDLNDKLVPVRVHALVRLKNLILANDHYTCSRIPQLYSMIECSLADQEPYVFLASINLLAEMGLRKTDELLPKLMNLYSTSTQQFDVQQRLNVGEVLVRLIRRLHQMTPHYAQSIMSAFLEGTQSSEELIRVSSLANIGEICRNLGDSLGKYMVEILHRVEQILENDSIQTKCAAIGLLREALMGLDGDFASVESIQRELKSIYALLKRLRQKTLDEKLCLQADLALDEIDRLARAMLMPSDSGKLVKNIKVLSLLD